MTEILPVAVATAEEKLAHPGPGDLVGAPLPGVTGTGRRSPGAWSSRARTWPGAYLADLDRGEPAMTEHVTGDLARIEDGAIVLAGRATDMIIRGRTNIYPGLHEPVIARLPGVHQAVLVGVPDAIGDERVVLALVGEPGAAERVAAALPGVLDAAALPDRVVQLDALPTAGRTRKVDRAALRELVR
jgi:acyl-CoA synthetase (AMP-forming)/AMP-acid ligase II